MHTNQAVAAEVRAAIARAGLRQADLADAIGISRGSLSSRLSGERAFRIDELVAIARVLGVQPSVLLPQGLAVAA